MITHMEKEYLHGAVDAFSDITDIPLKLLTLNFREDDNFAELVFSFPEGTPHLLIQQTGYREFKARLHSMSLAVTASRVVREEGIYSYGNA